MARCKLTQTLTLRIAPPAAGAKSVRLEHVSAGDTVLALRQLIAEFPALAAYTCYRLEVFSAASSTWVPLNDFVELGEYEDVVNDATLRMVLERYDARKARAHFADGEAEGGDAAGAAASSSTTTAAAVSAAAGKSGKSKKKKSKQPALATNGEAAKSAATAANGAAGGETPASEISEKQLQMLRDIHAKLEGVTVPVLPELADFYTLPGASAVVAAAAPAVAAAPPTKAAGSKGKKSSEKPQPAGAVGAAAVDLKLPTVVKSIVFSGYNPPPGPRKLAGDLLYLEVAVADGAVFHVTAHVDGFFVNRSTAAAFDPLPRQPGAAPTHLLVDVLAAASDAFKSAYAALLAKAAQLAKQGPESLEWMLAAGSSSSATVGGKLPWLAPPPPTASTGAGAAAHTYDLNRAEDELTASFGMDERGVLRDWNEEYQCCRELPRATLKEQVVRARVLYKIVGEFVDAATQGAVAIVEGHIPPINPMDDASAHVYVFNNIFFSLSVDGRAAAKDTGSDEAPYASATRDLQGVRAFNDVDVPGLHTLATAVVDYLGVRVIAQSVIPGILQGEAASKLVYGSVDGGKTIASNDAMHALMRQAAEKLHIAERRVQPLGKDPEPELAAEGEASEAAAASGEASTEVATLCGPVEAKGILGSDGRMYVLDLVRITPKDATYYDAAPATTTTAAERDGLHFSRDDEGYVALLRPELVQLYALWKQNQARKALKAAKDAEKAAAKQAADKGAEPTTATDEATDEATDASEDDEDDVGEVPAVSLNPNVFMKYAASVDAAEAAADEASAKDAAAYLQNVVIPAFVTDIRRGASSPADGHALTELMHSCGINMRYLGRLAALAKQLESVGAISKYVLELLEVEMVARAAKHVLADLLNADEATRAAPGDVLVQVLNGLLGGSAPSRASTENVRGKKSSKSAKAPPQPTAAAAGALDAPAVWARVEKEVQNRFDYALTLWTRAADVDRDDVPLGRVHKPVLLRRLCQRNGLRVTSRHYDFSAAQPFALADLAGVVPVVKHSLPAHPLPQAKQLLERGRLHLGGGALASAYELLQETSALLFQVCGAAHEDAALCSTSLATVLFHAGDVAGAVAQQQRALALYTQLAGADYHDTAFAHANLALFLHAGGQTDVAVAHMRRALFLLELGAGPHYPEVSALYFKLGMMCQDVGQVALALLCHRESLKRGELDRVQAANTLRQMALTYGLAGGFREALAYEKKVYALFSEAFGEDDPRAVESAKYMAKFTERAVEGAKGRVEVDAAAAADAAAHQLLEELTIKAEAPPKKKSSKKSKTKKH
ncbi:hypothetical protein PybrP1_005947 [[Pythium] brassicae (nom. inval.)]|nr:hypothetical protein PybrP1_005947 [[Pythium] brassicae (nom. inval.)]